MTAQTINFDSLLVKRLFTRLAHPLGAYDFILNQKAQNPADAQQILDLAASQGYLESWDEPPHRVYRLTPLGYSTWQQHSPRPRFGVKPRNQGI